MASNRDRLREASMRNSEAQKTSIVQETLVSNIANAGIDAKNNTEEEKTSIVEKLEANSVEKPAQKTQFEDISPEIPNETETPKENIPKPLENNGPEKEKKKSSTDKKNSKSQKTEKKPEESKLEDKYNGSESNVTLILLPEVRDYLERTPVKRRVPMKTFFKSLLLNELSNGKDTDAPELAEQYRQTQHNTVRKSVPVEINLQEDAKDAAANYGMRYTNFMAYVIHKAMLEEKK